MSRGRFTYFLPLPIHLRDTTLPYAELPTLMLATSMIPRLYVRYVSYIQLVEIYMCRHGKYPCLPASSKYITYMSVISLPL